MKAFALGAAALGLLSSVALAAPASAASYNRHGQVSAHERAAIARSAAHLAAVKHHARVDGRLSLWERAQIRMAEARHSALVRRLRHN